VLTYLCFIIFLNLMFKTIVSYRCIKWYFTVLRSYVCGSCVGLILCLPHFCTPNKINITNIFKKVLKEMLN